MRITIKFLVKSLIVVVILMFGLPLLIHHLDSQEWDKLEAAARQKRDRALAKTRTKLSAGNEQLKFVPAGDNAPQQEEPPQENVAAEEDAVKVVPREEDGPDLGPKEFGPTAVLKPGVLGNFEPKPAPRRPGPGENGVAVYTTMEEKAAADRSVQEYGFNMVASDKIAMDRSIPDTRLEECKYWQYPEELPTASVILVFHNEGFSTLLRTVHSIINTSPAHLLHEVVMVDDFSEKENLRKKLEDYIVQFNGKVKLYRNSERLGLIGTRTRGAELSTGDVIIFLDAHCECSPNWLTPLLARIAYDRTIMAVPIVDGIDWNTMSYHPTYGAGEHFRGIFEWGFLYKESHVPRNVLNAREHNSEPYKAPTHAGGLFAMDRKYFFEMGAYDRGLQIWGGENFELSFKIWQCGGSIEWVPCSKVGHIYRNHMPYGFGKISPKIPIVLLNYMRVIEVWLDPEQREYFYTREPTIRGYPIGDIQEQLEFKAKHKCRTFKWFLDNVATEVLEKFPAPPPNLAWGEVKVRGENICWDAKSQQPNSGPIGVYQCHHYGGNQLFRLNVKGQLGMGERCIEARSGSTLHVMVCKVEPTGDWEYDEVTGLIKDKGSGRCCEAELSDSAQGSLSLKECDPNSKWQQYDVINVRTW